MTTSAISELGKLPFEGVSPVGSDVRGEPGFDLLETELSKLSSPVHSASIDWNKIARLSAELLSNKGKDLMVACYLTGALFETRSLGGMADGLQVVADLLETYWDTMYPPVKRLRGRRNAVQWLVDRVQQRSTEAVWTNLPPQELALVERMLACLQTIEKVLLDKDSEAPSVRSLLTIVRALPIIAEKAAARPAAAPAASASAKAPADAASTAALESSEDAKQALSEVCTRLEPIAQWLLSADLSDALPYRLNRLAAWTSINTLPPVVAGQTPITGPVSQVVDVLEKLKTSQSDEDLVNFAEAQLAMFPLWLDLNHVCSSALERMGNHFDAARIEVCGETARLVARLPGLEKLVFASGMPFADSDTLAWLAGLAAAQGGSDEPGTPRNRDAIAIAVSNARTLAASHDLVSAVDCLQQQLALGNAPRDDLILRIRLCDMLLTERPGAALEAFATTLVDRIEHHHLTEWDPALALDGLQVAYRVMTRNEDNKPAADTLLKRVVALDPLAAVKLVTS